MCLSTKAGYLRTEPVVELADIAAVSHTRLKQTPKLSLNILWTVVRLLELLSLRFLYTSVSYRSFSLTDLQNPKEFYLVPPKLPFFLSSHLIN